MQLHILRYAEGAKATSGLMIVDGLFHGYTLENGHNDPKVAGKTRIPAGMYQIRFRELMSPMTKRYRAKYPWFTWHLELQDVPDFSYVYLHIGNKVAHTDGCPLVGNTINNPKNGTAFLGDSASAFEPLYRAVSAALNAGEQVWIAITELPEVQHGTASDHAG